MIRRALIAFLILAAPLSGCTGSEDEHTLLPEFTVLKEDGSQITNADFQDKHMSLFFQHSGVQIRVTTTYTI